MNAKNLNLFLVISLIFCSCNPVFFTEPQPYGSKNIFEFPVKYRGVWMEGPDTIVISANAYLSVSYRNESVPKSLADTSSNYLLVNDKIFFVKKEDRLQLTGGYPYTVINDTIFYKNREVVEIFLGAKTFLRKVSDMHILNIKSDDLWWEIILVEKAKNGGILGRRLSEDDMKLMGIDPIMKGENVNYFDVKWKEKELEDIINRGCFSDTLVNLSVDNKIRKRRNIR